MEQCIDVTFTLSCIICSTDMNIVIVTVLVSYVCNDNRICIIVYNDIFVNSIIACHYNNVIVIDWNVLKGIWLTPLKREVTVNNLYINPFGWIKNSYIIEKIPVNITIKIFSVYHLIMIVWLIYQ